MSHSRPKASPTPAQFLESYKSVTLASMARAFGVSAGFLDRELVDFIVAGRLPAKIDKVLQHGLGSHASLPHALPVPVHHALACYPAGPLHALPVVERLPPNLGHGRVAEGKTYQQHACQLHACMGGESGSAAEAERAGTRQVAGVIETTRPDAKNAQYQAAIKQGDLLLNRLQKLSKVVDDSY